MRAQADRDDPEAHVEAVATARGRMDNAIIGFNRHANLVERYRVAVLRYRGLKSAYETGVREREEWREARLAAATRRTLLRAMICDYVHRLRDEGVGPERVLIAVKGRMVLAVTKTAPAAPDMEADALMHDASDWVISAYYEAA